MVVFNDIFKDNSLLETVKNTKLMKITLITSVIEDYKVSGEMGKNVIDFIQQCNTAQVCYYFCTPTVR